MKPYVRLALRRQTPFVLTHPVPGAAVSLAVDASDSHVGAPSFRNNSTDPGLPLLSSPRSYPPPNPNTPPLIVNSSQLTPPFAISDFSLKLFSLLFSQIINPLP